MALTTGSQAPDFTLKSLGPNGLEDITLSNNFGKRATVLLFFPLAFTSVCTQEFCDVTAGLEAYTNLNASVIGISVDSPFAQSAWAKQENISIPLASDLNKEVCAAYDVVFNNLAEIGDTSARAAFVIDREGIIRYSEQTPTPKDLPNFEKIRETLQNIA
ncbi:MAG: peroxiredoxin [Terrimicrobiaceae bacterium]